MRPNLHLSDPQWYLNSGLQWGTWKLLDAILNRITGAGNNGDSLGDPLGGAGGAPVNIAPYISAAAELGLSSDDIATGMAMLQAPDSHLRVALADVLRPDFATPQAALAYLKERLAELDPLEARLLLALVAGASRSVS